MDNNSLQILPQNKTFTVSLKIQAQNETTRTGVILENSFFHSIFRATSNNYQKTDLESKKKMIFSYIQTYRINPLILLNDFSQNFKNKSFKFLSNKEFYKKNVTTQKDITLFNIVIDLLVEKKIKNFYTDSSECIDTIINYTKESLLKITKGKITKSKEKDILNKMYLLCNYIFNNNIVITDNIIDQTADNMKHNIYIFDSSSKLPIKYSKSHYEKNLVLLSFQNKNFEIIGEIVSEGIIKRVFNNTDKFIENIRDSLHIPKSNKFISNLNTRFDNNISSSSDNEDTNNSIFKTFSD